MTAGNAWRDLSRAIEEHGRTGPLRFWLRDDDAVEPTAPLEKLVGLCERRTIPLTLAVIPADASTALATFIESRSIVTPVVHGWSHANHASEGEKKQELGAHRPASVVFDDLRQALARMHTLFGERLEPLLVPPWNRIDAAVIAGLAEAGFSGLSTFGPVRPAPIACVNATIDIIDWHGTRGCRDHDTLASEIAAQVRQGEGRDGQAAIGLLTHHLVHDEAAWAFLERLFEVCSTQAGCRWATIRDLLDASGAR